MQKFDANRPCIKCGYKGRRVISGDKVLVLRQAATVKYIESPQEALLRTCKRCDYKWLEMCVDS